MKLTICFLIFLHHSQGLVYGPVVRIPQGELQGTIEESVLGKQYVSFKGIRYGKPPVGKLRFKDPLPAEPWTSRLNASKFGSMCPSLTLDRLEDTYAGNDDCLFLNVYTPPDFNPSGSPPKAVMFWIYGGSFNQGSGEDGMYGPDYLVAKDVIVVTVNYRLGALGFLNVEDESATGNQGLKDQVLALKWVQRNIAHFGGNPKSVTIFGESSGGTSVHYLTLSPMADGLYHKAIAQSNVVLNPSEYLPYSPTIHARELAAALGNPTKDPKELVEFLRGVDGLRMAEVDMNLTSKNTFYGLSHFVPSVDLKSKNPIFPQPVDVAVRSGVKVPFMLGYMSFEGMLFLAGVDDERWKLFDSDIEKALSPGVLNLLRNKGITLEELRKLYFGDKKISQATRTNYVQMQSDLQFTYGIHDVAAIQTTKTQCPTYMYIFSYDNGQSIPKEAFGIDLPGAVHSDDLAYLFYPNLMKQLGRPPPQPGSKTSLVIDRVTRMWTDFAKTGNPTPAKTDLVPVIWKPIRNADKFKIMDIGEDLKMRTVTNVNKINAEKLRRIRAESSK